MGGPYIPVGSGCKLHGRHYNQRRPHSALGYLTPGEFAATWQAESAGTFAAVASVG